MLMSMFVLIQLVPSEPTRARTHPCVDLHVVQEVQSCLLILKHLNQAILHLTALVALLVASRDLKQHKVDIEPDHHSGAILPRFKQEVI